MTYARKSLVCLDDTPYYHVVARCVRRAWLWGFDEYAGKDYSHRKQWILERLRTLSEVFAIDICAYAIMSNHYHLVVRVDRERARTWTPLQVVAHWTSLFARPALIDRWLQGECGEAECEAVEALVQRWRHRLTDVSWYMRCLNEHLARRANTEDGCKGRFWEGRFRSQALLGEAGLLTAMVYVDLNPIRAGIAASPEDSKFTSIQARIRSMAGSTPSNAQWQQFSRHETSVPLLAFADHTVVSAHIPYRSTDYLQLVDWTGRVIREGKPGAIDSTRPSIMTRLNIDADAWQAAMQPWGNVFGRALGRLDHLRLHAEALGQSWIRGQRSAARLFPARS